MTVLDRAAPARPGAAGASGGPVAWRTWLVRPDRDGEPMLTGLFGHPWPERVLDARCLHVERAASLPFSTATTGRYHRVVPDVACTCGVYTVPHPFGAPPRFAPIRSEPTAAGFVEMSGRVLAEPGRYRAQRATIVGPLVLGLPSPPWVVRLLVPAAVPVRVFAEGDRYRISPTGGRRGEPIARWRRRATAALERRYGVPVIPAS